MPVVPADRTVYEGEDESTVTVTPPVETVIVPETVALTVAATLLPDTDPVAGNTVVE